MNSNKKVFTGDKLSKGSSSQSLDDPQLSPPWRPWERWDLQEPHQEQQRKILLRCCKFCHCQFRRESELRRHHHVVHFAHMRHCQKCGKAFTRQDNLTRHLKTAHSSKEKSRCQYCSKILSRQDAVPRHEANCRHNPSLNVILNEERHVSHRERLEIKLCRSFGTPLTAHRFSSPNAQDKRKPKIYGQKQNLVDDKSS